ncbi:modified peptide precursor CbpA [Propionivibrio dicarboxylicus]|uniref:Modified peptide CbpA n=1 Tax=Propionivibrio dicarboxylicus TaxID=83767 RepID=A0A1G7WQK9_9RHOO|nr:modified peptide precursor CbpA [Propionivibrio dicarboxylicus]SDG74148.1 modified peptide precursor CbpA [Propionivibrio dicarboxylicus]
MSPQQPAQPATQAATQPTAPVASIAMRKRCHPDGIGLSHYVLMDRRAAK